MVGFRHWFLNKYRQNLPACPILLDMGCHDAKLLEFGIAARSLQPSPGPRSSGWFSGWMREVAALVTDVAGLRQTQAWSEQGRNVTAANFFFFPEPC